MSKSKGNVVCPFDRAKIYTTDGLRYFLLREGVAHSDGSKKFITIIILSCSIYLSSVLDYSDTKILRYLNAELADTLGNLLSRCTGVALNPFQTFPKIQATAFDSISKQDVTKGLIESVISLPSMFY